MNFELSEATAVGVAGVRHQFPGHTVTVTPDGDGGGFVVVDDVPVGAPFVEDVTWLGFHINSAYPASDVYPHYVGRLRRRDGHSHGEAIQEVSWRDRPALQLSRRSSQWSASVDTAALKAMKVMAWLRCQ
ncbi:hypothetical protein ACJH6H_03680 [Mycobacterium sp. SMC-21]|uniref:hypothetical protein n=1 Tax=unclassified Mycobacterium TaxID=2642494 RepID=UPI00387713BB